MNKARLLPAWQLWLYKLSIAVLAVSGMAQMPIFKRYYLADVPGLGWTADFYFNHLLHYAAATVLLALLFYLGVRYLANRRGRLPLSAWGWVRAATLAGLVATGFLRVLKNLPSWHFSPTATMIIDWTHLGLAVLLGIWALAAWLSKRPAYVRRA